ncbi:MAG: arginine repressor [Actinobacteria bacterium]|nr:arginine repressor [Actinomycetota bacterium]
MKRQRQAAILKWINSSSVKSQNDLVEALRSDGFEASQTTVSRDLRELGVMKTRGSEGGLKYASGESGVPHDEAETALRRMANQFLLSAEPTSNMVVIKTLPGTAQGVAAAIDAMDKEGIAGTVAGDDTILVVCSEGFDSEIIGAKLIEYTKS